MGGSTGSRGSGRGPPIRAGQLGWPSPPTAVGATTCGSNCWPTACSARARGAHDSPAARRSGLHPTAGDRVRARAQDSATLGPPGGPASATDHPPSTSPAWALRLRLAFVSNCDGRHHLGGPRVRGASGEPVQSRRRRDRSLPAWSPSGSSSRSAIARHRSSGAARSGARPLARSLGAGALPALGGAVGGCSSWHLGILHCPALTFLPVANFAARGPWSWGNEVEGRGLDVPRRPSGL
jgi:hypothetical protein